MVGAGPAGMLAAGRAAENGHTVMLWDANGTAGRKLGITGKGRCNLTNDCDAETLQRNILSNPRFLHSAFAQFGPSDVMDFFESLGVALKVERGQRVFPQSDSAADVTRALTDWLGSLGVTVQARRARELVVSEGAVTGVSDGVSVQGCDACVLCTGGLSYPATGSRGDGYALAERVGHHIVAPAGSLVPLVSPDAACAEMQGLSLRNVTLSLEDSGGAVRWREGPGEMLFTHFGVSGPLVLSASAHWRKGDALRIDLKPGMDEAELDARLLRDFQKFANKEFQNALGDLLPKSMIPVALNRLEIDRTKRVHSVTRGERETLLRFLKAFALSISGQRPVAEAVVTRGGVSTKEIDPRTMASRLVGGLSFAGELIDVDAYTGGFNLQIAWSTGHAAGMAI